MVTAFVRLHRAELTNGVLDSLEPASALGAVDIIENLRDFRSPLSARCSRSCHTNRDAVEQASKGTHQFRHDDDDGGSHDRPMTNLERNTSVAHDDSAALLRR